MKLDKGQWRIVQSKPNGCSLVRGKASSGKTTAAVHRVLYLKNNYCLLEEDEILWIAQDLKQKETIHTAYKTVEQDSNLDYRTLFSSENSRVTIKTIDEIIEECVSYSRKAKLNLAEPIESAVKQSFIEEGILELKKKYSKLKLLDKKYLNFIIEEMDWIRACNFRSLEEYQNADRVGRKSETKEGPKRVLKNSSAREAIYALMEGYIAKLKQYKKSDEYEREKAILAELGKKSTKKYTHIVIDEAQNFTKLQLDIVQALKRKQTYSSLLLFINSSAEESKNGWLVKGRKKNALGLNELGKSYLLAKEYINADKKEEKIKMEEIQNSSSMENFQYCDIRHHRDFEFSRDSYNISEVIVNDGGEEEVYREDEVLTVPVYSDIAAGEPILIHSEQESNFYIPRYWLKGMKDCFILKVKGDSMIGANIEDGDYVVLRKQVAAQNGDIVAADLEGSATLKRLLLKKGAAYLMPENSKYSPISLQDREASILGIAVGLIKNKTGQ